MSQFDCILCTCSFPSSTSNRIDFFSIVLRSTHNGTWNWNWIRKLDAEKKNQHFNLPFKNFNCISFEILRPNDATKWSTFKMICMCRLISCYCISKFNGIKNGKTFLITIQEKGNPSKISFSKWVHENQWHVVDRKSYENERVALNSVRSFDLELIERNVVRRPVFETHTEIAPVSIHSISFTEMCGGCCEIAISMSRRLTLSHLCTATILTVSLMCSFFA